jgi:hypothetical protein
MLHVSYHLDPFQETVSTKRIKIKIITSIVQRYIFWKNYIFYTSITTYNPAKKNGVSEEHIPYFSKFEKSGNKAT